MTKEIVMELCESVGKLVERLDDCLSRKNNDPLAMFGTHEDCLCLFDVREARKAALCDVEKEK